MLDAQSNPTRTYLDRRVEEFRAQVQRRIDGSLTEDEFRPLRLMNGLYLQLHAYMLRVAIPYGTLNADQLDVLAEISERWDRGYGHFTTRQNIQYNWPKLPDVPDMLARLADVNLHAIQTSGNTIRNVTADPLAGAHADELMDPRPVAELIRIWSTDHPEYQFLGRKFKIAVTGSPNDRAVTKAHDLAVRIVERDGEVGYQIIVGGGLGRTPVVGKVIRDFLPQADLLPYLEAVLSVYNLAGRRDNKYKARIKITVNEMGLEEFSALVDEAFARIRPEFKGADQDLLAELQVAFEPPALPARDTDAYEAARAADPVFRSWSDINLRPHFQDDHAIAMISLKPHGGVPGDASADQMRLVAALARKFGNNEIRVTQEQNLVLPHVAKADLPALHAELKAAGLATANVGLASDIIACPGMDYCALATARSIPIAQQIAERLEDYEVEVGEMAIKISGCINACGHHHLGDIGILGLDRAGVENYQITLGGDAGADLKIGDKTGPGFGYDEVTDAIERLILAYLDLRAEGERFRDTIARTGSEPFKAALYEEEGNRDAA
ncbi:sulfite reductase (NADPH) hemoprotein beta-component [Maritimibacter alkaliphilus HTCC2654]|uniref:Sulfite/nitrite reductase hemoprotein subunit n=1 Tax=Maritimibacter alkaliphilus HTCC2654 TaxID=314271 RepID=A3VKG4_9RHOB|nr:nitrite/sulfite reductase [Maritimibacter alkaliphilus]EAQ11288.1 Sulfite/nitrite reductase hemoprotein subunit [Maritimibacter alkaliphilus HTCC2654]TYP81507.1 sulfite reductase (NADPH) hemoprotein beta-component [Maritimibacter alkaliphilus HTCC2654]